MYESDVTASDLFKVQDFLFLQFLLAWPLLDRRLYLQNIVFGWRSFKALFLFKDKKLLFETWVCVTSSP